MKSAAEWVMETADRMGTEFIWNSVYQKGLKQGVKDPIKYADDNTRRLVAGRGIGEVPLMQKSKLFQTVAPFTLEVANLWRVQKDFIKSKDFAGLVILMLGNYLFNKVSEEVRGSGVTFDPIQAIIEASANDLTPAERGGRIAGEVISNVPLGSTIANFDPLFPEYGGKNMFGINMPTRKKLFGDNDPTRFGTGLLIEKGLQDPLYKLLPGFGGNQIKKTLEGAKSLSKGGAYGNGNLKYQIEKSPQEIARALAFGPSATKGGQEFYSNDRRPLTETETNYVNSSPDPQRAYEEVQLKKRVDTLKASIARIKSDPDKTDQQKQKEINVIGLKIQKLIQESQPPTK
jgi:hypothetical protein